MRVRNQTSPRIVNDPSGRTLSAGAALGNIRNDVIIAGRLRSPIRVFNQRRNQTLIIPQGTSPRQARARIRSFENGGRRRGS